MKDIYIPNRLMAEGDISYGLSMNSGWELGRGKGAREEDFVEMGYYPGGHDQVGTWPGGKEPGGKVRVGKRPVLCSDGNSPANSPKLTDQ